MPFLAAQFEPITVAGEVLKHRLFHLRLLFSGWCHVEVEMEGGSLSLWR